MSDAALTHDDGERRAWRTAVVVIVVAWLVRLAFAARLPLFPDETYYWDWSRRLAGGYFDHPPMIALLIRAGTALAAAFGLPPSPVAVLFYPLLAGAVAPLAPLRRGGDTVAVRRLWLLHGYMGGWADRIDP